MYLAIRDVRPSGLVLTLLNGIMRPISIRSFYIRKVSGFIKKARYDDYWKKHLKNQSSADNSEHPLPNLFNDDRQYSLTTMKSVRMRLSENFYQFSGPLLGDWSTV